jgi:hypothetical protein
VASRLARSKDTLIRKNAIAVLVRADTPESRAELASLGEDAQALAVSLHRAEGEE